MSERARALRSRCSLSALILAAFAASSAAAGAQEFDWRKHEGTTIYGIVFNNPGTDAFMDPLIPEFEQETGITVRLEKMVDTQMRPKQDIILTGQDPSMDFFALQMDNRGGALTAANLMEDLEPYLNDPELTPPGYDYPDDWAGGCLNTAFVIEGQPINNIVYSAQAQLLHIRRDLFEEHGVKVPETLEELEAAAEKLTIRDSSGNVETHGFLARGWGQLATASFASYLFNHGGTWSKDENGRRVSAIHEPEAIDAFEYYGRMIREYAPEAALNNRPNDNANLFAAGRVAMLSELNYFVHLFQDPNQSRVVDKVETILVPQGPGGSHPNLPTTSLAISPWSQKKEAAWTFLAWMTQKDQMLRAQKNGAPMCRKSAWTDPSYEPPTASWGEASRLALEYGVAIAKPQGLAINEIRDAVGEVINVAIRDGSRAAIEEAASRQAPVIDEIVARTEQGISFTGAYRPGAEPMPADAQRLPIDAIKMGQ